MDQLFNFFKMSGSIPVSDPSENYLIYKGLHFWFKTEKLRNQFYRFALMTEGQYMDPDLVTYIVYTQYHRYFTN